MSFFHAVLLLPLFALFAAHNVSLLRLAAEKSPEFEYLIDDQELTRSASTVAAIGTSGASGSRILVTATTAAEHVSVGTLVLCF